MANKVAVATNKMYNTTEIYSTLDSAIAANQAEGFKVKRNTNTQTDWSRGGVVMERGDGSDNWMWAVLAPEFQGPEIVEITLMDVK